MHLKYILELTSPISNISLPEKISNIQRLRVNKVRYVTASLNNHYMIINIKGWNDSSWLFNGTQVLPLTCFLILPPTTLTLSYYENTNMLFDSEKDQPIASLSNFMIELLIDGNYSSDISPSNPVYLELYCE